jgi:hypothetical protein
MNQPRRKKAKNNPITNRAHESEKSVSDENESEVQTDGVQDRVETDSQTSASFDKNLLPDNEIYVGAALEEDSRLLGQNIQGNGKKEEIHTSILSDEDLGFDAGAAQSSADDAQKAEDLSQGKQPFTIPVEAIGVENEKTTTKTRGKKRAESKNPAEKAVKPKSKAQVPPGRADIDFLREIQAPVDDLEPDPTNEVFLKQLRTSLESDVLLKGEEILETPVQPAPEGSAADDGSDFVADMENEIENAEFATNPFEADSAKEKDDFIAKLQELFPENYQSAGITKPLDDLDEINSSEFTLSQESWRNVIKATEEDAAMEFNSTPPFSTQENSRFNPNVSEKPLGEAIPNEFLESSPQFGLDNEPMDRQPVNDSPANFSDVEEEQEAEGVESVDVLRRSFIEDFEQTPWLPEAENTENEEGWLKLKFNAFLNWIKSLNTAEKALLIMSSIISLAVVVAIALVVFDWKSNQTVVSNPPEVIDSLVPNQVYPTGLQLPGGWFFYLQEGQLKNNKWNPQTAEWLPETSVRRVVAIPWSRQAEAVVQTLNTGDEIRVFMNNNDVMSYYVEEVSQIDREDVDVLTDTEPSLAVILFKSDNSDRWVIVAKP